MKLKNRYLVILLLLSFMFQSIMPGMGNVASADDENISSEIIYSRDKINIRSGGTGTVQDGNTLFELKGSDVGSFIECGVNVAEAGTYHVTATMRMGRRYGIVECSVNSKPAGGKQDTYRDEGDKYAAVDLGYMTLDKPGNMVCRFTVKGRNDRAFASDIGIHEIQIRKESIRVGCIMEKPGNIFTDKEPVTMKFSFDNMKNEKQVADISFEAVSSSGTVVNIDPLQLTFEKMQKIQKEIQVAINEKNTYILKIKVSIEGGEENIEEIPFSYVEAVDKNLPKENDGIFGTITHFIHGTRAKDLMNQVLPILQEGGMQWVRDEYPWSEVEKEKGQYIFPHDDCIKGVLEHGMKELVNLSYGNKLYGDGTAPDTDEGRTGYANYAKAVAEHLKGKVDAYEIWNEWNGGFGNPKHLSGTVYAELLKAAYTAIKSVDPNIKVIAGATIMSGESFFTEMFEAGGFDYCDGISYHPYCMPNDPDTKNEDGNIEDNISKLNNLMKIYGKPKELWITELGWYTGTKDKNVTEEQQACYMTRAYTLGMAYGLKKLFWYDFQDDGTNPEDSENNYGMIKWWRDLAVPYAAKPSYVALNALTNKLKGAAFVKEFRPTHNTRVYKFNRKSDKKDIVAMWSIDNDVTFTLKGESEKMQAYDMYGNPCKLTALTKAPIFLVGESGQFDFNDMVTDSRISATAVFGRSYLSDGIRVMGNIPFDKINNRNCYTIGGEAKIKSILMDIDDAYIFGGVNPVQVTVDYLDEGDGSFYLGYDAINDTVGKTEPVKLTDTKRWKHAVFELDDARFANKYDGADLKLELENPESRQMSFMKVRVTRLFDEEPAAIADLSADSKWYDNAKTPYAKFDNMVLKWGDDLSGYSYVQKNGRGGLYSNAKGEALYISLNINDEIVFGGANKIQVSIDYFDEGNGSFDIGYDVGTWWKDYGFTGNVVKLSDTKTWKTAVFTIDSAYNENRCGYMDLRVSLWTPQMGRSPGGVCFGKITVKNIQDLETLSKAPTTAKAPELTDITGHWADKQLKEFAAKNIIAGYSDNTYRPDQTIQVDEFIKLLLSALKIKVSGEGNYWASPYIDKAKTLGIVAEGEFADYTRNITRGEIARMVARVSGAENLKNFEQYQKQITDYQSIDSNLAGFVVQSYAKGLISGYEDGSFLADHSATRAEAAILIYRLLKQ